MGNLISYSAGLFLASVRSCLKTTGVMKMYGMFFCDPWKVFELFAKISFFLKNY